MGSIQGNVPREDKGKVNVLLVSGLSENAQATKETLENLGIHIVTTYPDKEGLRHITWDDYTLIAIDIAMAETDGFQLASIINEFAVSKQIPIFLFTEFCGKESGAFQDYMRRAIGPTVQPEGLRHPGSSLAQRLAEVEDELEKTRRQSKRETEEHQLAEAALKKSIQDVKRTFDATIIALTKAGERRGLYTTGHNKRVARLSSAIAHDMGLSEDKVEGMRIMGLLHDIGKIVVPSEILSKPTKLTSHELDLIRSHSEAGYEIIKEIEFVWPVATAILQHHERLDGSGYPHGIKDEEMIIESRILTVAEVVEAMSTNQLHRPLVGLDDALEEISANRGTLYDPDVVDACIKLFREKQFSFE